MTESVSVKNKFKRGELRTLSTALIEKHWAANPQLHKEETNLDELAALHVKAFGFELPIARTHVRWMVREGLVKNGETLSKMWPKKSTRIAKDGMPEITAPRLVHSKKEAVKPAKEVKTSKSKAKAPKRKAA